MQLTVYMLINVNSAKLNYLENNMGKSVFKRLVASRKGDTSVTGLE